MSHQNFHQFKAENNFDLGRQMGEKFAEIARVAVRRATVSADWPTKIERAKLFLKFNQEYFPEYVEEIRGYAQGAGVGFLDLYTISLEDEVSQDYPPADRCTTFITNDGKLVAHNEDWDKNEKERICVVQREVGNLKILELYYYNALGGNAVSINSNGFIVCINSLFSKETKMGLSKNIIAHWLSETKDPEGDFLKLKEFPRALGYNGNIVNKEGKIWNIEYNSNSAVLTHPMSPFVHANHYLTELKSSEDNVEDNETGTVNRYQTARDKIKPTMNLDEMKALIDDQTDGPILSIMNERTNAKVIVDTSAGWQKSVAKIWLARESSLGFVDYPLP